MASSTRSASSQRSGSTSVRRVAVARHSSQHQSIARTMVRIFSRASGVRIGCAALSTRGMNEDDMRRIGDWIAAVLNHLDDNAFIADVAEHVRSFAVAFPLHVPVWET